MVPFLSLAPVIDPFATSDPVIVPLRMSLPRRALLRTSPLRIEPSTMFLPVTRRAAYDVPPSAMISASVAVTFAYETYPPSRCSTRCTLLKGTGRGLRCMQVRSRT